MGDGTEQNPYTCEDLERKIEEHGGTAKGLYLSGAVFEAGINLSGQNLEGVILEKAKFPLNLRISRKDAPLRGADLKSVHLEGAQLRSAHLEEADLSDAYLESANLGYTHLEGANLMGAHLGSAYLGGAHLQGAILFSAEFSRDTGLESVNWGNYILEDESMGFDLAADTYRQLKMWYTEHGIADIAAKFYYREKEAGRKALKWRSRSTFWHRLALEASHIFFGYGEKWWNILLWIAAVIFGLAGAYHLLGGLNISHSIYYSVVSFTALGYGSWVSPPPEVWVQRIGAAESFVGVFMMALLLVTFVRKWTR